ncbi:F0F1 ATP synthase subunit B [Pandoraea sp.]|uniref:F0F1 ATP synthase subunit B family protein n=1 Tax=Pandoraea sp. TaxID=1883445 RepID=UPI001211B75F|nr:F0F1 ATP synthase subunit B [Pandoraea sp.]TAL53485.1 MAG: F0F1 ATP synthase subunit B [Pandoraea sp.]TAM14973.1 MAG: F0F1 ATP synthase subunit B [Pandoraea sp.]
MHIDWWTLGLQAINALVLVWLLARFLFRPIAKIVGERQRAAAALLADAEAARHAALDARQQAEADAARVAEQRGKALDEAAAEAGALKASLIAAAHAEADQLRAAANTEIAAARREAARSDARRASQFALEVTAKLLERLPPEARVAGFIDGLAAELAKLPGELRTSLGRADAPLRLVAARILSAGEQADCRRALSTALGHEAVLSLGVDPAVLAGFELEAPHAIVRNSLRADLSLLQAELQDREASHD